jgi:high-affinity iron transporter
MLRRLLIALGLALACLSAPVVAAPQDAQTAWRLLDYLSVDYAGAVQGGKVISAPEYAEMREFSGSVGERIQALPATPAKAGLLARSARLQGLIQRKASPPEVAAEARGLAADLLTAYPVPLGPKQPPDLARGAQLFQQDCAACHGAKGDANTAMARQLDPPPIAFADR